MDYQTARKEFSMVFERLRKAKGVTYLTLERHTDVANSNLVAMAKGRRPVKMATATKLANALCLKGTEREYFLNLALATHEKLRLTESARSFDPIVVNLTCEAFMEAGISGALVRSINRIERGSAQFDSLLNKLYSRCRDPKVSARMVELHLMDGGVAVGCFLAMGPS